MVNVWKSGRYHASKDVRAVLDVVTPEGDAMIGTITQAWIQQGLKLRFGLAGVTLTPEIAQATPKAGCHIRAA
jgi:hypothetical protein